MKESLIRTVVGIGMSVILGGMAVNGRATIGASSGNRTRVLPVSRDIRYRSASGATIKYSMMSSTLRR